MKNEIRCNLWPQTLVSRMCVMISCLAFFRLLFQFTACASVFFFFCFQPFVTCLRGILGYKTNVSAESVLYYQLCPDSLIVNCKQRHSPWKYGDLSLAVTDSESTTDSLCHPLLKSLGCFSKFIISL